MNTFLTKDEIKELTGYRFKKCQRQALSRMGIEFLVNPRVGNPIVLRSEIERQASTLAKTNEPTINLKAMREAING